MAKGSKQQRSGRGGQRHISVRVVRRDPPDLKRLSRALIALAMEQAAAEAAAEAQARAASPDDGQKTQGAGDDAA